MTTFRLLTAADAAMLERVDGDVFDNAVRPDLVERYLVHPDNLLAVAIENDEVVGMATGIVYVHPDKPPQLFVNEVGVATRCHRQGIATALVKLLLERARALGCTEAWVATEEDNAAARALYRSMRGREDATRAVVYTWSLADANAAP